MENYTIIGQRVQEISVRTDRQTQVEDLLYRSPVQNFLDKNWTLEQSVCIDFMVVVLLF